MLKEQAKIVAVEKEAIWVETIQLSTCGSCSARKGCGQALLSGLGAKPNYVRVLFDHNHGSSHYVVNQFVTIGLPESIVVKASLFLYLLPLVLMILFAMLGQYYFINELFAILMAGFGLFVGGFLVRFFSDKYKDDERFHPKIIEEEQLTIVNDNSVTYGQRATQ